MRKVLAVVVVAFAAAIFALGAASAADDAGGDMAAVFKKECASCHGKDGKGTTKMGTKLKVRDLTDPEVQKSFTDDDVIKAITEGIKNKDTGKFVMKSKKDKLTADQIKALVPFVRAFEKK